MQKCEIENYDCLKQNNDVLEKTLLERQSILEKIRNEKEKSLLTAPPGKLHIASRGKYTSYYRRNKPSDVEGEYIKKSELPLIRELAQKAYDINILEMVKDELDNCSKSVNKLKTFLKSIQITNQKEIHLINPIIIPDDEYIKMWQGVPYEGKTFDGCKNEFYTSKGERVRSKSEVMIAETLTRNGIPYRYEFPVKIGGKIIYPDFYCLNVHNHRNVIYEHFGLMDNIEYVENVLLKISAYEQSGLKIGYDYIFTMETSMSPLSTKMIDEIIKKYLK